MDVLGRAKLGDKDGEAVMNSGAGEKAMCEEGADEGG